MEHEVKEVKISTTLY